MEVAVLRLRRKLGRVHSHTLHEDTAHFTDGCVRKFGMMILARVETLDVLYRPCAVYCNATYVRTNTINSCQSEVYLRSSNEPRGN